MNNFGLSMELCGVCKHELEDEGRVCRLVKGGTDRKVDCARCGRRRYGGEYVVAKRLGKEKKGKK